MAKMLDSAWDVKAQLLGREATVVIQASGDSGMMVPVGVDTLFSMVSLIEQVHDREVFMIYAWITENVLAVYETGSYLHCCIEGNDAPCHEPQ